MAEVTSGSQSGEAGDESNWRMRKRAVLEVSRQKLRSRNNRWCQEHVLTMGTTFALKAFYPEENI